MGEAPRYQSLTALWNLRDDRELGAGEHRVLGMLIAHANDKGQCCPSTATLAAETRMRKPAVRAAIRGLERSNGPIRTRVVRGRKTANGDADSHAYTLSPGAGWTEQVSIGDNLIAKTWDGARWVDREPTRWVDREPRVGSESAQGYAPDQTTVGRLGTEGGAQIVPGVGSQTIGGGSIGNHKEEKKRTVEEDKEETVVFDHWASMLWLKLHKIGKAKPTLGRMKVIRGRLKDGLTVEQLCRAIDAVASTPWYLGNNERQTPYIEPKTIFRNLEKVEELLLMARSPRPLAKNGPRQPDSGYRPHEHAVDLSQAGVP